MWRGHKDCMAVCNAYQFSAKIITVRGLNDDNPEVTLIEPNPKFSDHSLVPAGTVPDMIFLHEYNSHYSLIVPEDCRLATDGGLDYQRREQKTNSLKEDENMDADKVEDDCEETEKKENEKKDKKVDELDDKEKIAVLQTKCTQLEN